MVEAGAWSCPLSLFPNAPDGLTRMEICREVPMAGGVPEAVKHMGMFETRMNCTMGFPQSCSWFSPSLVPDGAG